MRAVWGAVCLLMAWTVLAGAQPAKAPVETKRPAKVEPGPAPTAKQPSKDPTEPTPKLREVLDTGKIGPAGAPTLPTIVLRGRVIIENQPAVALLEFDPKQPPVPVSAGATLGLGGLKLKVLEITATEVRIEISSREEVLILR